MHSNGLDPVLSSVSLTVAPTLSAADPRDTTKMLLGTPQELLKNDVENWKIWKQAESSSAAIPLHGPPNLHLNGCHISTCSIV